MPWWRRPWFELKVIGVWIYLLWERVDTAKRVGKESPVGDSDFMLHGSRHLGLQVSFTRLLEVCLNQNDCRLAPYDDRLLRPKFVPKIAHLVSRFVGSRL